MVNNQPQSNLVNSPATIPSDRIHEELALGEGLSIINLLNCLIKIAHQMRASDIHIDPTADLVNIRFRIDGVLIDRYEFSKSIQPEFISRIKILASLRTDEHQTAQDGRFRSFTDESEPIDVRVSIIPTYYGENAVLRLLSDKAEEFSLESLGFTPEHKEKILRAIRHPHGMILATGPTGSGKTTTLYTVLKLLNTRDVSVITIEDPIEYSLKGTNQIQVNPRTNLTFANGLRSVLRQDPNIIMVGEIRDVETAGIAVNTALTGHLLLSTLHTNDSATTLPRLLDLKIEPYLVASTVNLAIGQRLVRRVCPNCRIAKALTSVEKKSLAEVLPEGSLKKTKTFYQGKGCENCSNSGYMGRVGIYEVLVLDREIQEAVLAKASANTIYEIAIKSGMTTMIQDGIQKAQEGITTLAEVLRMRHE